MPTERVVKVVQNAPGKFLVTIIEGGGQSSHRVSLKPDYYHRLTAGKVSEEVLIGRSFEFLLEREPKESILPEFDLSVISRYFSSYEAEIKNRLGMRPS